MEEEQMTTPFDDKDPNTFGEEHKDDGLLNAVETEPVPVVKQEQQQKPEPVQVQEAAPVNVTVNISGQDKTVTDIKTDGPPGSVGSAKLDGKSYVVVEADKYQPPTSGGRKSKKRAAKRSARKSSKRRKSGRKGRR